MGLRGEVRGWGERSEKLQYVCNYFSRTSMLTSTVDSYSSVSN